MPVTGKVGVCRIVYRATDHCEIECIPTPLVANEHTMAAEIEGDSLGIKFNRWYTVYDDVCTQPTTALNDQLCVVKLDGDQMLVKVWKIGKAGLCHPTSGYGDSILDVRVVWTAHVKNLLPR